MRKILRTITATAGIISAVSAAVLGCIYLEDVIQYFHKTKGRFVEDSEKTYGEQSVLQKGK